MRIDVLPGNQLEINGTVFNGTDFPRNITAIHGHFSYSQLTSILKVNNNAQLLIWVRDPAERIISNYFYFKKIIREDLDNKKTIELALPKMEKTILEYAQDNNNRNIMSALFRGINIKALPFIGVQEFFHEDLAYLAGLLGWKSYKFFHENRTGSIKERISPDIMKAIR